MTKKAFREGTHRAVVPEETVRRVSRLAPLFGLTRVANVTGLDRIGIPVFMACRPNARSLSVSQGKGQTPTAAKASAIMESVELFHAERIDRPLKLASYNELRYSHNIPPINSLSLNPGQPFDDNLRMLWIEATDILVNDAVWVPFELVNLDCTDLELPGAGSFLTTSNGLASGNDRFEAVIHGICEVVERDALHSLVIAQADGARRLDLATVDDPDLRLLIDRVLYADCSLDVHEITTAIGIPVFRCVIKDLTTAPLRTGPTTSTGAGCHPSRNVALSRAITEAAQSRLTLIAGSRDDLDQSSYTQVVASDSSKVSPDVRAPVRFADVVSHDSDDLDGDLDWMIERLRSAGFSSILIIDHTMPAFDISVVRVIIPYMSLTRRGRAQEPLAPM